MPPSRFLGHIAGFAGCIFPHSRSSSIPEVPPLPDRKGVFSVLRPALRHRHGTLALHHGDGRGKKNCSPMGNSAFPILGRLVNTGLIKRPMCATHKASPGSVRPDGPPGQSQEVGASTHSGICLPRVRFLSRNVPLFSTSKEDAENLGSHSRNHQTPRSASTHLASTTGSPRIIREDGSSWSPSHEGNSLLAPGVLGLRPTHVQPIRPSVSIGTQRSLMVDVGVQCVPGFTHCASGSNRPLPHGRISIGMGSALGHAHHLRTMDSRGSVETYQRSRVRRGGQSLRKVETPSVRPEDSGRTRQLDCSCLPEPPRRHQVASPSPSHRARVRALRRRLLHLGGQTHTREKERPCRQPLQGGGLWHQASGPSTPRSSSPSVVFGDHPTVDLFATRQNTCLPIFVSPIPDVAAMAIDAMSLDWREMWGYAYPPHALLPLILRKILFSPCKIILVAPLWPASRWFVQLLLLLVDCPLTLPLLPDLLTQDGILHRDPSVLKIHAWRLSGRPSRCEAFRSQWPNARHGPSGILLLPSTSRSGVDSWIGVAAGKLIPSRHLPL